jgi:hypothetical protein
MNEQILYQAGYLHTWKGIFAPQLSCHPAYMQGREDGRADMVDFGSRHMVLGYVFVDYDWENVL